MLSLEDPARAADGPGAAVAPGRRRVERGQRDDPLAGPRAGTPSRRLHARPRRRRLRTEPSSTRRPGGSDGPRATSPAHEPSQGDREFRPRRGETARSPPIPRGRLRQRKGPRRTDGAQRKGCIHMVSGSLAPPPPRASSKTLPPPCEASGARSLRLRRRTPGGVERRRPARLDPRPGPRQRPAPSAVSCAESTRRRPRGGRGRLPARKAR